MGTEEIISTKSAPIVNALAQIRQVKAVLCFGSYAMGAFDQDSDVDLYVLCHPRTVSSSSRRDAFQGIEDIQDLQIGYVEPGWENQWCPEADRCRQGGLVFDICYNTVDWMRSVVGAVKDFGATSIPECRFRPYTILGLLENSVILYDPESILRATKSSLYPYPTKLQQTLLSENLAIANQSLLELQDYVRRSIGNSAFHFQFSRILDAVCTIVFAINERYDPATKRTEQVFTELEIVPNHFLERYGRILEIPLTTGGREEILSGLGTLLREITDLAKGKAYNRPVGT